MALEPPSFEFKPKVDSRKRLEEPLGVYLEAVADMHVEQPAAARDQLDELYVTILRLAPLAADHLAYRSDTFALHFDQQRGAGREDYRPIRIAVRSLADVERQFAERETEYSRQKSLLPGHEALILQDPDGNWLEIREHREIG